MQNKLLKILSRILLFQFLIYFSIKSLRDESSYKEYRYKINALKTSIGYKVDDFYMNIPKNTPFYFKILMLLLIIISIMSMANFKIMQLISGLITIIIGFIYYNPIDRFREVKERHILLGAFNFDEYLPNINFNILFVIGLAMIGESFDDISSI